MCLCGVLFQVEVDDVVVIGILGKIVNDKHFSVLAERVKNYFFLNIFVLHCVFRPVSGSAYGRT